MLHLLGRQQEVGVDVVDVEEAGEAEGSDRLHLLLISYEFLLQKLVNQTWIMSEEQIQVGVRPSSTTFAHDK